MTQLRHFELELADLKRSIVAMGDMVDRAVALAVEGVASPSADLRERARTLEDGIDAMETVIEDRCHTIIALQNPMVRDLRFIISAMSIASDLEQVGDHAESVSKRAHYIACHNRVENPPELGELGRLAQAMLRQSMDAFVTGDGAVTRKVIEDEPTTDRQTKACYAFIQERMAQDASRIKEYTHLLRAVSSLEQIGDLAMAIAEETVFMHQAQMIRHNHDSLKKE
ncbi:MAG: phosphate signaling complex protein PhoU [Planctomycetes bacterium]|nr:phosphate signaling complex protein PhoU [Planctomycetota bacterium]